MILNPSHAFNYPLRTQEWTLWPIAINLLRSRGTAILAGMPTTQH